MSCRRTRAATSISSLARAGPRFRANPTERPAAWISRASGDIRTLVNNAANDQRHDWQEVTPGYWDERMAINLRPMFFAIQAVVPQMLRLGSGSIINFGSISWKAAQGGMPAYTAAKAAVHG